MTKQELLNILDIARDFELTNQVLEQTLAEFEERAKLLPSYELKAIHQRSILKERATELWRLQSRALSYLDKISGEERSVLELYYIQGFKWDDVATNMYCSVRKVYMLRKSAIQNILKLC